MEDGLWYHIRNVAKKKNVRFVKCNGVLYEVTALRFPTGPSPVWSIDKVSFVEADYQESKGQEL